MPKHRGLTACGKPVLHWADAGSSIPLFAPRTMLLQRKLPCAKFGRLFDRKRRRNAPSDNCVDGAKFFDDTTPAGR
jgi:hypothetical protein